MKERPELRASDKQRFAESQESCADPRQAACPAVRFRRFRRLRPRVVLVAPASVQQATQACATNEQWRQLGEKEDQANVWPE